jgi:carbon-monoxide dehydrogenase iron sulfur subunit
MHRENGRIVCDVEKCVGCWTCIMVCPYGVIKREEGDGKRVASKCDLCPDREIPACVANCPNEALIWVE